MSGAPARAVAFRPQVLAQGFSWRKRALLRGFAQRPDIRFQPLGAPVPAGADLLLWGSTPAPAGLPEGVRIVRVEDGFLRSVGLGADLVRPLSWVFDDEGMYYDPGRPSRLERMLLTHPFAPELLARAQAFRQRLVALGLTKYNLPAVPWAPRRTDRPVVLVVGQVESDASVAAGAGQLRSNAALLQAVRQARPDAWLVYKPHPDVVAGLRRPGAAEPHAAAGCDELVTEGSLHAMLAAVDELHVMTSLAGFEALLRGKKVCCHGQPFYAGYGLTEDAQPHPRRNRRLPLDALVAAALLLYPSYRSLATGLPCSAEQAVDELQAWRRRTGGHLPAWRRWLRPLLARP